MKSGQRGEEVKFSCIGEIFEVCRPRLIKLTVRRSKHFTKSQCSYFHLGLTCFEGVLGAERNSFNFQTS